MLLLDEAACVSHSRERLIDLRACLIQSVYADWHLRPTLEADVCWAVRAHQCWLRIRLESCWRHILTVRDCRPEQSRWRMMNGVSCASGRFWCNI